jgi:hypothetical protein
MQRAVTLATIVALSLTALEACAPRRYSVTVTERSPARSPRLQVPAPPRPGSTAQRNGVTAPNQTARVDPDSRVELSAPTTGSVASRQASPTIDPDHQPAASLGNVPTDGATGSRPASQMDFPSIEGASRGDELSTFAAWFLPIAIGVAVIVAVFALSRLRPTRRPG